MMEIKSNHLNGIHNQWNYCCILILFILAFSLNATGNLTVPQKKDCVEPACLKCNTLGCIKCQNYIIYDDRQCVNECPRGYTEQWSSVPDLMGRVCRNNGYSGPMIATIVGLSIGSIICILMLIFGITMIKKKQQQTRRHSSIDDTIEKEEFLKQLDELRPNASYFLAILNDTRCQIRKLYLLGDHSGVYSYKTIIRDLAKILILLNRPLHQIPNPTQDWNRLYLWALKILDQSKVEIVQLIDFLQAPTTADTTDTIEPSQYSTFKPAENTIGTGAATSNSKNFQQLQLFESLISLHEFEEPKTSSDSMRRLSCLSTATMKREYPSSEFNNSSLWLEDEFFKLGLRPQDEITTEL